MLDVANVLRRDRRDAPFAATIYLGSLVLHFQTRGCACMHVVQTTTATLLHGPCRRTLCHNSNQRASIHLTLTGITQMQVGTQL